MSEKLDKEALVQVWKDFVKSPTTALRETLITSYLHLVKYVIGRLGATLPSHIRAEDMYSTGILGLIKAIEKYDPTMKNKFETYAILLIKGAIIDEMRSLDWVPRSVHQKANIISKAQAQLQQKLGREPNETEVSKFLNIPLDEYQKLLDRVRPAILIPLTSTAHDDPDQATMADRIPDQNVKTSYETADYNEFRKLLESAVVELPEQERTVLVLYYYENLMLKEIGKVLGVSESRVSQIHTKAVLRLRTRLKDFADEFANLF